MNKESLPSSLVSFTTFAYSRKACIAFRYLLLEIFGLLSESKLMIYLIQLLYFLFDKVVQV